MLPTKPLVPHSYYLSIFPYLSALCFPSTIQISYGELAVLLEVGSDDCEPPLLELES